MPSDQNKSCLNILPSGVHVVVEAFPVLDREEVLFVAQIFGIQLYAFQEKFQARSRSHEEVEYYFRCFIKHLQVKYPPELGVTYDLRVPNLYSAFLNSQKPQRVDTPPLWLQGPPSRFDFTGRTRPGEMIPVTDAPKPDLFEVNLTEPLVGWKAWRIQVQQFMPSAAMNEMVDACIYSIRGEKILQTRDMVWTPCEPATARCPRSHHCDTDGIPNENHSCGIYAADEQPTALEFYNKKELGSVFGEMYGWGRYVRGEKGFRCQFAYPKSFYLTQGQFEPDLIEMLKEYRVTIHIMAAQRIYDPSEDGYADFETLKREVLLGNRTYQEDRDLRAGEDASSEKD